MGQAAIDHAALLRNASQDEEVAREVLGLFAEHAPGWLRSLDDAPDLAAFQAAAHRLKGAARGIGAHHLAESAALGEALSDEAARSASVAQMQMAAAEVLAEIARLNRERD